MKKYKFQLDVIITSDFVLTGKDKDDVEQQAIDLFKKNNPDLKVDDYYGRDYVVLENGLQ